MLFQGRRLQLAYLKPTLGDHQFEQSRYQNLMPQFLLPLNEAPRTLQQLCRVRLIIYEPWILTTYRRFLMEVGHRTLPTVCLHNNAQL
ncbi:hypothetical protein D3C80_1916360 [compost metagenome]